MEATFAAARNGFDDAFKKCMRFTNVVFFRQVSCFACRADWNGTFYDWASDTIKMDISVAQNVTAGVCLCVCGSVGVWVCGWVRAREMCVCVCLRVRMCAYVRVCVRVHVRVYAFWQPRPEIAAPV